METREFYWLHIVLQSQQTALEPEDTCRQAASTIHMHPRSPESLLMALPWFPATGFRPPWSHAWSRNVEAAAPRLQGAGVRPEHLPEQGSVDQQILMPLSKGAYNVITVFEGYFSSPPNL